MRLLILTVFWGFIISSVSAQVDVAWQRTNGPLGGDATSIIVADNGTIIAGTRLGGFYRSTDGGQSWQHLPEDPVAPLLFSGVWDLVKNSQGHLFAATNRGVYRSTDNGDSWTAFQSGFTNTFVRALAINAIDVIFAGTNLTGIFRSEDNGETWMAFNNGLTEHSVRSLTINSQGDLLVGTINGIFFSDDNGDNWSERSTGLISKNVVALFATSEDSLLAGTFDGAFRSSDEGLNWQQVINNFVIWSFAENSNQTLFSGGTGWFFRSIDQGLIWQQIETTNVPFSSFQDILVDDSGSLIAASSNYAVVTSADSGSTWMPSNTGIFATDVVSLSGISSGGLLAGTGDGLFRSTNDGTTWSQLIIPETGFNIDVVAFNNGRAFAATGGTGLYMSDNSGDSWSRRDSSLTARFVEAIAFANDSTVYAGGSDGEIFKSEDNGDSWTQLTTGIPNTSTVQALGVSIDGTVFAGTREDAFRSTDGGALWEQASTGLNEFPDVTAFLAQANGDMLLSAFQGIFRTTDNGDNWVKTGNVPTQGVNALAQDTDGNLYVASRGGGVSISEDSGATWKNANSGLEHQDAHTLFIDNLDNLYVGTRGGGVFKGQRQVTSVDAGDERVPRSFELEQNYPNPFNPVTKIRYSITKAGLVKLTIYDLLGKQVRALINENKPAGEFSVFWDGRDDYGRSLASGQYFYRLKTGKQQSTRRMILLK